MSESPAIPDTPPPAPTVPTASIVRDRRFIPTVMVALLFLIALPFGIRWLHYRFTHSIAEDAFVQSHLVNLGPQQVAGHIVDILVEERDAVKKGQLLARIDPTPYLRQVELDQAKHQVARANLAWEESVLKRLTEEVPRRIEVARQELAVARQDDEKAKKFLELTEQDVAQSIHQERAGVDAARAVLTNADEDYRRYSALYREESVSQRRSEEATKNFKTATADLAASEAKLAKAEAERRQIDIATAGKRSSGHQVEKAAENVRLAEVGNLEIEEARQRVKVMAAQVAEAERSLDVARTNFAYTNITTPFDGIVVKRYRNLGDYAAAGAPILTIYNPELIYVTANLEETRLTGVAPGNEARLDVDAFDKPFHGRVVWIGQATGANFSLVPRDVSSGEFTRIVQRVPVRIWIEKDDRWLGLRPGLSVTASISHGAGDLEWARQIADQQRALESGLDQHKEPGP